MKPTLSVIIPALNEETNIADAVAEVLKAVASRVGDYELLLFNDGSRDRTGAIMDELAAANPRIRVTHNPQSHNLGGVYKQGLALARLDYLTWVPGDNENPSAALLPVLDAIGRADIVLPYPRNMHVRPFSRRIISRTYTLLMNVLFLHWLPYYNGTSVYRTADLRSITLRTSSFAFQAEILVKLLRQHKRYCAVGIEIQARQGRASRAFRWRNVVTTLKAVSSLMIEVYLPKKTP